MKKKTLEQTDVLAEWNVKRVNLNKTNWKLSMETETKDLSDSIILLSQTHQRIRRNKKKKQWNQ